jgi:hypothetical protein
MVTEVSPEQRPNAFLPIVVTLSGMITVVNPMLAKADLPMEAKF